MLELQKDEVQVQDLNRIDHWRACLSRKPLPPWRRIMVDIEPALVAFWGRFTYGRLACSYEDSFTGGKGSKLLIRRLISSLIIPIYYYSLFPLLLSNLLFSSNFPRLSLYFLCQFFSEDISPESRGSSPTPRQQAPCPIKT